MDISTPWKRFEVEAILKNDFAFGTKMG